MLHRGESTNEGARTGRPHGTLTSTAARLSDADLLCRVAVLAAAEREAVVELVAHLAELDARRLYLGEGCGSLFSYCTGVLRLAEHAAYNRIEAARAAREFPEILELLADGSLNLTTVRLLAPHLRRDNFATLAGMAKGKSKREVEVLVARLAPRPDVPSSIRRLPATAPRGVMAMPPVQGAGVATAAVERALVADAAVEPAPQPPAVIPALATANALGSEPAALATVVATALRHPGEGLLSAAAAGLQTLDLTRPSVGSPESPCDRPVVSPLAPGRFRVQFTVGEATHEKLRRAQVLLRRDFPSGDPAAIFDRALTLLLEDVGRRKLAETSRPRPQPVGAALTRSRHIPAHVKRAVWRRDGGQCAFVGPNGRRCAERAFLEFHHREPYAIGGEATVRNVGLRCHRHNAYEAELAFGEGRVSLAREARAGHSGAARGAGGARVQAGPDLAEGPAAVDERDGRPDRGGRDAAAERQAHDTAAHANSSRGELDSSCGGTKEIRRPADVALSQRPSALSLACAGEAAAWAKKTVAAVDTPAP